MDEEVERELPVDEIYRRARELREFSRRVSCEIFFGSVFNDNRGRVIANGLDIAWDEGDGSDWLVNFEDEIKATRFDLCTVPSSVRGV